MTRRVEEKELFEKTLADECSPRAITVAVSLFNYEKFLPSCLDSVKAQTHGPIELIIVDDRSEIDDSVGTARRWLEENYARFERVLLLRHLHNQGLAQARNTAFLHARTERVFVIDADNEIYPRCLGRLSEAMDESGCEATYSQLELFGDQRQLGYGDIWSPEGFYEGNYVDAMALVSRKAWADVGGYTHIEGGWEDYDFWCKFVECGFTGGFVPEILGRYRVHGTSMLRSETVSRYASINIEMSLRHPWLRLPPLG
ncbi:MULTISPECIES: glycosyltransferase family 2 protein [Asaia]|uniref:glycosyltransferase family 2 protein n=1 Tax=Asaia TaxID=91914 RepID=UPI002553BD9A|nr:glycosyltransferase family A protein [Asaia sp. HumB]MDL2171741.1 glycosyltransferase family A protein [Asaia sp. HumB]